MGTENANAYMNHYAAVNPRIQPILSKPVGAIHFDAAILDFKDRTAAQDFAGALASLSLSEGDGADLNARSFSGKACQRRETLSRIAKGIALGLAVSELAAAGPDSDDTGSFSANRPDGQRPFLIVLRRVSLEERPEGVDDGIEKGDATLIVAIRDPDAVADIDTKLLQQSYDLSPVEVDIAVALDGEIVSFGTLRTHEAGTVSEPALESIGVPPVLQTGGASSGR